MVHAEKFVCLAKAIPSSVVLSINVCEDQSFNERYLKRDGMIIPTARR